MTKTNPECKNKCVSNGMQFLSNPPQFKCIHCGRFWYVKDPIPDCLYNMKNNWPDVYEASEPLECRKCGLLQSTVIETGKFCIGGRIHDFGENNCKPIVNKDKSDCKQEPTSTLEERIEEMFNKDFSDMTQVSCTDKTIPCGTMKDAFLSFILNDVVKMVREEESKEAYNRGYADCARNHLNESGDLKQKVKEENKRNILALYEFVDGMGMDSSNGDLEAKGYNFATQMVLNELQKLIK